MTRDAVAGLAGLRDAALAGRVRDEVAFPNGMVDRITPATGAHERAIAARFGLADDPVPVTCEPFRQWVLEDRFPTGRPALERVGVTFTDDVHAFETMKIRILNGGHAAIAYPAGLLDIVHAHEALAHPLVRGLLDRLEAEEVLPGVPPVPGVDLAEYYATVRARFANPEIADTIRRLCFDGFNRQPKFIVPSLRDGLAAGRGVAGLALVSALWCRYCFGETDSGAAIAPNDPDWDALRARARQARDDPAAWRAMRLVYGDLGDHPAFAAAFDAALRALWRDGTAATLARYVENGAA